MFLDDIRKTEPILINELGVKFWRTDWFEAYTVKVPNSAVFLTEHPDGTLDWLLTIDNKPAHSSQLSEDIACHLEARALSKSRSMR